jgi:hypothetical protein
MAETIAFVSRPSRFACVTSLACRTCNAYNYGGGLETGLTTYGGFDNATSEGNFEEKACDESRTGDGRGWFDVFTSGRCVSRGVADSRCAGTEQHTRSTGEPRYGRALRRQPRDVLCLRQGEHRIASGHGTGSPRLRLQRLQRLSRLQRLPGLQRLRRLRRLRRRRLLSVVGRLPHLLKRIALRRR